MCRIAVSVAALVLAFTTMALAQAPYDDEGTPEGWAWVQIRNDKIADFGERYGKLDPHVNTGWEDPRRRISAKFLVDVLTVPKWRDQIVRHHHVRLRAVRIDGMIDLSDNEITPAVRIEESRIEGDLILAGSHWDRLLSLHGSTLAGNFSAGGMRSKSDILLDNTAIDGNVELTGANVRGTLDMHDHATFGGDVMLRYAKVGANLDMDSSSFAKTVNTDGLTVGGSLWMRHATFAGDVILRAAKVGSTLEMDASSFSGAVMADPARVEGNLFMRNGATFAGDVILIDAKVGGNLDMGSSSFAGALNASPLSVAGDLVMRATFGGNVLLAGAKVGGDLAMDGATFRGEVSLVEANVVSGLVMDGSWFAKAVLADSASVGGSVLMRAKFGEKVDLVNAKIGGVLNLFGATAVRIDLSDAVAREFLFGDLGWWCAGGKVPVGLTVAAAPAHHWRLGDAARVNGRCSGMDLAAPPPLTLRNAHVEAFQDSTDAWPPSMDLEGFRYDRLGGLRGAGPYDMRRRSPEEWTDWLARDPIFSTQPYTQLATVLLATGHRDTAEAIQFAGRERERDEAWKHGDRGTWEWLTILSGVAGYGIGLYTFRVLWWVLAVTAIGAVVLWYSPNARAHGVLWVLGASLHRLLPIVELSKEFKDFFENPPPRADEPRNLNRFQIAWFAGHALAGWILGFFLLAAMSGLTQKG